ncbi:AAA family ATPase [Thiocapsa sp.]|uniref:AAA family ATPase n=1 Tax=Thiocapsa sp. TaxID=2024551 RepID=UPI00342FC6BD
MIPRHLATPLEHRLNRFPAVALLGPRQVGKTTLAESCRAADGALYLDLENPSDLDKLSDPRGYLEGCRGRLTIIDERTSRSASSNRRRCTCATAGSTSCPAIASGLSRS